MNQDYEWDETHEIEYREFLAGLASKAKEVETKFLNNDENYIPKNFLNSELILICEIFRDLMFYPTTQIIEKLTTEFGLHYSLFDWFIPIERIDAEFDTMIKKGLYVDKLMLISIVYHHLIIKFHYHLCRFYESIEEEPKVHLEDGIKFIRDYLKRNTYQEKNPKSKKSGFDQKMEKYYGNVAKLFFKEGDGKEILKYGSEGLRGKTDNIIKPAVKIWYDQITGISQTDFLDISYDFFKIILQDVYLPDKETFDKLNSRKRLAEDDYRRWRTQKLRRIIL